MGRKTIAAIIGTRPNFIKYAALQMDLDWVEEILIHTGQHYSDTLSKRIWDGLGLREPDHIVNCGHDKPAFQFECMIRELSLILQSRQPDYVLVVGDCNTTLGGALAANFLKIPIIHIEAGLRSFDMTMPEERNRKLTDHLAQVNFCISASNKYQLIHERCSDHHYVVGDLLYDSMMAFMPKAIVMYGNYFLATVHREENVNKHLEEILEGLNSLSQRVIFPRHPRIKPEREYENIEFMDAVDYVTMLSLLIGADFVFTDSGGLQREAVWLGKPCVLLRDKTEFPEFVNYGHVVLAGHSKDKILTSQFTTWPDNDLDHGQDGKAGERIAAIIYGL